MAQGPDGNGFSSVDGDGNSKHDTDKILTAGPSTWQSAQTHLVSRVVTRDKALNRELVYYVYCSSRELHVQQYRLL